MAGTVHEVENHALLAEVEREAANAAQELVEAARLHRGQIVVIGCSTSEVVGHQVGSWSTPEAAQAIEDAVSAALKQARTPDIAAEGLRTVNCTEMGDLVCSLL